VEELGYYFGVAQRMPFEVVDLAVVRESPSVSIVVPTHNRIAYILPLLESLAQQQHVPFEVVVVDDGSTDGSFDAILKRANELKLAGRVVRLKKNTGKSTARNTGVLNAQTHLIAFIDSDCLATPGWLEAGISAMNDPRVGIVQGATKPNEGQNQPIFNHFIEIDHFDGSYSTCNIFYRKEALLEVGGFDPENNNWEDLDLGWRVHRAGWQAFFVPEALVFHQVIQLSLLEWLKWPLYFQYNPAKASRYPEYRKFLFLGLWTHWFHALFDLAIISLVLAFLFTPWFLVLTIPYIVAFPFRHGLRGRWPPIKALLHFLWDAISFCVLIISSLRYRSLVL
jgi:glycosyltransferase involved in cell wall biosynthesis